MMKRLLAGVAALVALASFTAVTAHAADLPMPAATNYYPPLPPAHYHWTGVYVGVHGGGDLLKDSASQNGASPTGDNIAGSNYNQWGLVGGAQFGVNYQVTSWVFGAEVSWAATNISVSSRTQTTASGNLERVTSAPHWFGSVTGRVGYALDSLLIYAKGGGAVMYANYKQDFLNTTTLVANTQNINDSRPGYTFGGGLEYGLIENVSAKVEYDFYDFGTRSENFTITPISVKSQLHVLEAGLDFRFNWER
jgi:outer membrane immunogenic protein